jgi:hypothetical protein
MDVDVYAKPDENDEFSRVLFRSNSDDKSHRFNGILFDSRGNILAFPVRRIFDAKLIGDDWQKDLQEEVSKHDYKIYYASNGTVITYYYYMGSWRISTSRGIEVDDYKLVGTTTYRDIFDELLKRLDIDPDTAFETDKCYSFVMSHPDYHILPYKCLVFLGGYNMKKKQFFNEGSAPQFESIKQITRPLGIRETVVSRLVKDATRTIELYETEIKEAKIKEEKEKKEQAEREAKAKEVKSYAQVVVDSSAKNEIVVVEKEPKSKLNYFPKMFGYILRTNDADGIDYYIESDLMELLKLGIFSTYRAQAGSKNRIVYFILKIWLIGSNIEFWKQILKDLYTENVDMYVKLLTQLWDHLQKFRDGSITLNQVQSKIYSDTLIVLANDGVIWETLRNVKYLDMYYTIWEEANAAMATTETEVDNPLITTQ